MLACIIYQNRRNGIDALHMHTDTQPRINESTLNMADSNQRSVSTSNHRSIRIRFLIIWISIIFWERKLNLKKKIQIKCNTFPTPWCFSIKHILFTQSMSKTYREKRIERKRCKILFYFFLLFSLHLNCEFIEMKSTLRNKWKKYKTIKYCSFNRMNLSMD